MAAAAAAAAAAARLSTLGGGRGPRLPGFREVVARARGYGYLQVRTTVTGVEKTAEKTAEKSASTVPKVGREASADFRAPHAVAEISAELLNMRLYMKYYKNTGWLLMSLFAGFIVSMQSVPYEIQQVQTDVNNLKTDVNNLKLELARRHEDCTCSTHVHHHSFQPPTTSKGGDEENKSQ